MTLRTVRDSVASFLTTSIWSPILGRETKSHSPQSSPASASGADAVGETLKRTLSIHGFYDTGAELLGTFAPRPPGVQFWHVQDRNRLDAVRQSGNRGHHYSGSARISNPDTHEGRRLAAIDFSLVPTDSTT